MAWRADQKKHRSLQLTIGYWENGFSRRRRGQSVGFTIPVVEASCTATSIFPI